MSRRALGKAPVRGAGGRTGQRADPLPTLKPGGCTGGRWAWAESLSKEALSSEFLAGNTPGNWEWVPRSLKGDLNSALHSLLKRV